MISKVVVYLVVLAVSAGLGFMVCGNQLVGWSLIVGALALGVVAVLLDRHPNKM
jgi:hypothetical protein